MFVNSHMAVNNDLFYRAATVKSFFQGSALFEDIITNAEITIYDIEPISDIILDFTSYLEDNKLKVYAINNGHISTGKFTANVAFAEFSNQHELLGVQCDDLTSTVDTLKSGDIIQLFELQLTDELAKLCENNLVKLYVNSNSNGEEETSYIGSLQYFGEAFDLIKHFGAGSTFGFDHTCYVYIDVENDKRKTLPLHIYPTISGSLTVDTMIIPNNSCKIKYSLTFEINGKDTFTTEIYESDFSVPIYNDDRGFYTDLCDVLAKYSLKNYEYNTNNAIQYELDYSPEKLFYESTTSASDY